MKRFAESHSGSAVSSTGAVHASRRPQRTSTRHVGSRAAAPGDRAMELAAAPRLAPRPRDALRPRPRTTRTKTQSPLLLASMAEERAATRLKKTHEASLHRGCTFPFNNMRAEQKNVIGSSYRPRRCFARIVRPTPAARRARARACWPLKGFSKRRKLRTSVTTFRADVVSTPATPETLRTTER